MISGIGVDIVEIDRIERALTRHPRLKERLFTETEREYCDSHSRPFVHYAMRFAAKEAVAKVLGTGMRGLRWSEIEVRRDERGRPYPELEGNARSAAKSAGIGRIYLSLSYTRLNAVASAIAVADE
jgi:holo-[acyl-carrier protein] synthase